MIDLIPPQFRIAAAVAALAAVALLAAAGGAKMATWKAEAACAEARQGLQSKIDTLTTEVAELKSAIDTANQALVRAEGESSAIKAAQAVAVQLAEEKAKASEQRLERLRTQFAAATSCGDVLSTYWNERK